MTEKQDQCRRFPLRRSKIAAAFICLITLLIIGAYEIVGRQAKIPVQARKPIVRTIKILSAPELETKRFPGLAKEAQIAKLSFRVPGKLIGSDLHVGKRITKEGVVARLDSRDFELSVKRLEAELDSAESLFSAMKIGARPEDVSSLKSQLEAATSAFQTTSANLNRFRALLADQVASQAQFDAVKTQFDTAKGQKETLENELEKAQTGARKEDIDAMASKISGLKASLETAKNALDDTVLKAPFDGMIVEKFIEDHEVIAPGIPVVAFVNASQIDVAVSLPEEIVVRLDGVRAYRVSFEAYPDKEFPARLKEIGLALQRGRQSYPLQVRVDLPVEDTIDGVNVEGSERMPVFPGMAATVLIDLARQLSSNNAAPKTVPLAALIGKGDTTAVWVVESTGTGSTDNDATANDAVFHVVRRPVKLLRVVDSVAEIEAEFKPSERIVVAGAKFLTDGQSVRLEE